MRNTPSVAALCCLLSALAWGGGCKGRRSGEAEAVARMRFENLTDFDWDIRLASGPGRAARLADATLFIAAKETRLVEVTPISNWN